jgi:hypothetical protein
MLVTGDLAYHGKTKEFERANQWFDEVRDRVGLAVAVLSEIHPALELDPEDRYAASIHGKVQKYSSELRKGLADAAALLGVYPNALTTCSQGKAETIAFLVVKECLAESDWKRWASNCRS